MSYYRIETKYYSINTILNEPAFTISFRNDYPWFTQKNEDFITSLILGIPAQSFYLDTAWNGDWVIIDGVARMSAVINFINNAYKISKNKVTEGGFFDDLEPRVRRSLLNTIFTFHIIDVQIPYDDKVFIFKHFQDLDKILTRIKRDE